MTKRAALLATFAAALTAVLLVACSGEQTADAPQPTPSSAERAERPAAEPEPQAEPVQEVQEDEPAAEAAQQQAEAVGEVPEQQEQEEEEQPDAVEAPVESEQDETISVLPPNVLGDPAARVHIIHFGDFQ